jgi:mycothiol synthase
LVLDGTELVGYAGMWTEPPCVTIYCRVRVHPDHRGRGAGSYLAQWAADRALEAGLDAAPAGARLVLHQSKLAVNAASRDFLLAHGYREVRRSYRMVIELDGPPPEPAFPEGIVMRPFDREAQMAALVRVEAEIFRDHWGYVALDFEQDLAAWEHWIDNDPYHDPDLWFLAMEAGGGPEAIAGVCLCSSVMVEDPAMGYVMSLGVRRARRRQGLGLAMLHHAFGAFYRRGKVRVTLDVDAESLTGATRLYEKAGMAVLREAVIYELVLREGENLGTQAL